ncbi:glycoside hydrolase family 26 protein [Fulvivirga ligni]|uniref:glycoside hydrolase family 26 protein n=1 Tax=Fulvivirga ligni TaxID=2904246 RepID=UPI001F257848|nr:glycosyl hydrolase [Fulvivirga ligni]UII20687.1 glycoside hydrolase family 26 protein [Fulvivirga ligni]
MNRSTLYTHFIKFLPAILLIMLSTIASCSSDDDPQADTDDDKVETVTLHLADAAATNETKALYSNLWAIQKTGFMFGHHDDLIYGRDWYTTAGGSDVKEVCGDYPAVFSVDFAEIMDDRSETSDLNDDRKRTILEARKRGEVITACAHLNNPLTGGDSWDNSDNTVVKKILEDGSETNIKFKSWLDKLSTFVLDLKDDNGNTIPIIFRPFHEHTQTWSWWGKSCTSQDEFIGLWKFTVDYLKGKGVHNLIYAISPQLDGPSTKDAFLFRYPGDDYVDFLGFDSYHGTYTESLSTNLKNLEEISAEKLKPCGVTETGIEGILKDGAEYEEYWTKEILTPLIGRDISLVVMWRNKYDPNHGGHHFFGPYIGHSSKNDFVDFYKSSITLFSKDLPDMYTMAENVTVE